MEQPDKMPPGIDRRSAAQEAERTAEQRFRRMADTAPILIWISNPQGEATFLSRSWYEFTGQGSGESTGFGWTEAVHPEDREDIREAFLRSNEERVAFRFEFRLRRRDGVYRWALVAGTPNLDENGEFLGYIGSVIDIAERKEAEAALRTSEGQFRALANSIPQLAWMAGPDGSIFWYNQRWYDYTGSTPEEMVGWGWRSVHDPKVLDRVEKKFRAAVAEGTPWEDTFPLRRHDGAMRWHLSRAMPLFDEQGEILLWFGTNTDISERREMEERLREADRRKDEFLATLAHELRNPLAPLSHGLEMLEHEPREEQAAAVRKTMARQLQNMVRLVDDLLDVSRVSRGRIELQCERLSLATVLEAAIETARASIVDGRHKLSFDPPMPELRVDGDATRLEQIFANLIENAAKYTDSGGDIRLSAEQAGEIVRVSVADNGIGMAPATRARVFDMFAQGDRAIERARGGLGIGLTIVRQLVALHGGEVEAHSEGLGKGSRFVVTLPLADAEAGTARGSARDTREADGDGAATTAAPGLGTRVLIVDDNTDAAEMLASLVEIYGHQATRAHDGYEALEVGESVRPEVIFLDIGMPQLNGYDTCRLIRARPWGPEAKIVAVTGWGQDEDKARSLEAGFDVHLVKPVGPQDIKQLLDAPSRR